ncbi:hypothetical protein GCM10028805_55290 [Spirosoma harenae]
MTGKERNYFKKELHYRAITRIEPGIDAGVVQQTFSKLFAQSDFGTKQMLLDRLGTYEPISSESIYILISNLSKENPLVIQKIFKLMKKQIILDSTIKSNIANLLDSENRFISKMAYRFLSDSQINDEGIKQKLQQYMTKNNLTD